MRRPGDISKITGVYGSQKKTGRIEKTGSVAPKKDVLSISNEARDYQVVTRALKDVPDVRRHRMDEIIRCIDTGSYNVSGRDVADKIIKSIIDKKI